MMPEVRETSCLVDSNWGLMRAIRRPWGWSRFHMFGSTFFKEMNERSMTMVLKDFCPSWSAVRWRALIFSKLVTRGSLRSLG